MKRFLYFGVLALVVWTCSTPNVASKKSIAPQPVAGDSTEYELIIIDPRFDQWYIVHYSDAKDYTNEYYRGKNTMAVVNWNSFYREGKYPKVIDSYIDYQPQIDYGIEVNRKLYWYFRFVESDYKIPLIHTSMNP